MHLWKTSFSRGFSFFLVATAIRIVEVLVVALAVAVVVVVLVVVVVVVDTIAIDSNRCNSDSSLFLLVH